MQQNQQRATASRSTRPQPGFPYPNVKRMVPVINLEGIPSKISIGDILAAGKTTVCHGVASDGTRVNSPAFHISGHSTVIGTDAKYTHYLGLPNAEMELLAKTWLERRGFKVTPAT